MARTKQPEIDPLDAVAFDPFELVLAGETIEKTQMPSPRVLRGRAKMELQNRLRMQNIAEVLPKLPGAGWTYHIVSDGRFDFWTFVPRIVELMGRVSVFYGSTWTLNHRNVQELLGLYDKGLIHTITMMTGLYFKRRESAVYAQLLGGLSSRGQRFIAFKNHAKIILLKGKKHYITVEGSANFTANPRLEQYVMSNSRELYEFHRCWMEEMCHAKKTLDTHGT